MALERMKDIHTSGAPAVLVVVYGNRAYEKALVELDAFASERGFKVIAGGTFVGEHSYSTQQNPIAAGRPDADDLQFAETFGAKIRTKIEAAAEMDKLYAVDVNRIQRPYQAFFPLFRFLRKVVKLRKKRSSYAAHSGCRHRTLQPLRILHEALSGRRHREKAMKCSTDVEKCIRCCACVKGWCPQKAPYFLTPFAALLADCFKKQKENRIIL